MRLLYKPNTTAIAELVFQLALKSRSQRFPNLLVERKLIMHFGDLSHLRPRANCGSHGMFRLRAIVSVIPTRKHTKFPNTCLGALSRKHDATGILENYHIDYRQDTLTQVSAPHSQKMTALTVTFYGHRRSPSSNEHR